MKLDLITTWRKHRLQEAKLNFTNNFFIKAIDNYYSNFRNNVLKKSIFDYRGVQVFAEVRKISDSPWCLVTKIDAEEVFETINKITWNVSIAVIVILIIVALILALLWRHQRSLFYRQLYKHGLARAALDKHYEYLTKFANDIIILANQSYNIIEANAFINA